MQLLILGGTIFLGRYIAEAALARGHSVTLFNRGKHGAELFPDAEHLRGDRDGNLEALRGRTWDAVIDTCGYVPRLVRASAELLAGSVGHYSFVSTVSVYADVSRPGVDETAPLATLPDPSVEEITGETYGALKVLCEEAVTAVFPQSSSIVRPGLIVGPYDYSDRFTYWPRRVARGGDVLAPGNPDALSQFVDVRDLADWHVALVERGVTGVFNATGPIRTITMRELLAECRATLGSDARFVWVDESFLLERHVGPWVEMPLWIPEAGGESAGFNAIDCSKAIAAGLRFRPLSATIADTYEWDREHQVAPAADIERPMRPGSMLPEREAALLAEWQAAHANVV